MSAIHSHAANGLSTRAVRVFCLLVLLSYPLGATLILIAPEGLSVLYTTGSLLILSAIIALIPILASPIQKIVMGDPETLDADGLKLREHSLSRSYFGLTTMMMAAMLYGAIASDAGWWFPENFAQFNAVFWGVVLYTNLLPAAFLAWRCDAVATA